MRFGKKSKTRESPVLLDEVRRDDCHTRQLGRLLETTMWAPGSLREDSWRRFEDHDRNGRIGLGHPNWHRRQSDGTLRRRPRLDVTLVGKNKALWVPFVASLSCQMSLRAPQWKRWSFLREGMRSRSRVQTTLVPAPREACRQAQPEKSR